MLFVQIGLAIAAWRRGWGPKALLPFAYGYGAAFVIGFLMALSGVHSMTSVQPLVIMINLAMIVVLGAMVASPRKAAQRVVATPAPGQSSEVTTFAKAA